MVQGCEMVRSAPPRAPRVSYRIADPSTVLDEPGTLALFGFGAGVSRSDDARWLRVALESIETAAPLEVWQVDGPVRHGRHEGLRWSAGAGWLFAVLELDEREHGGPRGAAQAAYAQLSAFLAGRSEQHLQRIWNYLRAINDGDGDAERYKLFCEGRAAGMGRCFADGFPAATAIGHHLAEPLLQVYALACQRPGQQVENPRQVSAWRYPSQYGRTPPSFARAMALPARDALAISGTAAVVGHASAHTDNLPAQLDETLANLEALLARAGMPYGFDARSPLKAYVRRPADALPVRDFLQRRLPGVPVLVLHGDICRHELLVEIDGWRYA
ncbi:pteridine-dependent deoxygenase [Dyella sp. C9]|uniref:chorismate transformation enzyme, FkbO/Hyg5 family n=1 Tax=Dyella sp. C9 TaxID=2202154 RepID=UPI000DEEBFA5|nr:pteridine-dependent deoxygenase [Dyella sp. C9]